MPSTYLLFLPLFWKQFKPSYYYRRTLLVTKVPYLACKFETVQRIDRHVTQGGTSSLDASLRHSFTRACAGHPTQHTHQSVYQVRPTKRNKGQETQALDFRRGEGETTQITSTNRRSLPTSGDTSDIRRWLPSNCRGS